MPSGVMGRRPVQALRRLLVGIVGEELEEEVLQGRDAFGIEARVAPAELRGPGNADPVAQAHHPHLAPVVGETEPPEPRSSRLPGMSANIP